MIKIVLQNAYKPVLKIAKSKNISVLWTTFNDNGNRNPERALEITKYALRGK